MELQQKLKLIKKISVCAFIFLILLLLTISLTNDAKLVNDPKLVNDERFNSYYNTELDLIFDTNIESGEITVSFYNSNEILIDTKTTTFYSFDSKTATTSFYLSEAPSSYKIISYSAKKYHSSILITLFIMLPFFFLIVLVSILSIYYKIYKFNTNTIEVYSGFTNHYIKVNGKLMDEHIACMSFVPISMSCVLEDKSKIDVIISKSNRITLKINGNLYIDTK